MMLQNILYYTPRLLVALILLQTLYFKFGIGGPEALAESQEIFGIMSEAILGSAEQEAVMRIGTGILELATAVLIIVPSTAYIGAIIGAGTMAGAVMSHLLFIGIEVRGDGGQLFIMAILVLLSAIKVAFDEKDKILGIFKK